MQNNKGWLTTFGDMLTLLLCFFISTLTLGPYASNSQPNEPETTTNGTDIANSKYDSHIRMLDIKERSFKSAQDVALPDLKQDLEKQVDPAVYRIKKVRIETCYAEQELFEGDSWHVSMSRALALRSHIIDSKIDVGLLSLRSLGPWCEIINEYEQDQQTAARLYIEIEDIKHG